MNLNRIIDAITREIGAADLTINQHADGTQSIHIPRSDVYMTSECPRALWLAVREYVRRDRREALEPEKQK